MKQFIQYKENTICSDNVSRPFIAGGLYSNFHVLYSYNTD